MAQNDETSIENKATAPSATGEQPVTGNALPGSKGGQLAKATTAGETLPAPAAGERVVVDPAKPPSFDLDSLEGVKVGVEDGGLLVTLPDGGEIFVMNVAPVAAGWLPVLSLVDGSVVSIGELLEVAGTTLAELVEPAADGAAHGGGAGFSQPESFDPEFFPGPDALPPTAIGVAPPILEPLVLGDGDGGGISGVGPGGPGDPGNPGNPGDPGDSGTGGGTGDGPPPSIPPGSETFACNLDDIVTTNTVNGTAGNDNLSGTPANDLLQGFGGDDQINAGAGDDVLLGGDGNDSLNSGAGNDILIGGEGDDDINSGAGDDCIYAGPGNDHAFGGAGNDTVADGAGDDFLEGKSGNDTLLGGSGADTLIGGSGDDVFVYDSGDGGATLALADVIEDFEGAGAAGGDVIDLSSFGLGGVGDVTIGTGPGGDATIAVGAEFLATLTGVAAASLDASDFVFA